MMTVKDLAAVQWPTERRARSLPTAFCNLQRLRSDSRGQNVANHRIDTAEQILVLQLLLTEPNQCFERNLVAELVILAQLQELGIDGALDQDVRIGATWIWLTNHLSPGEWVVNASASESPSGRNLCAASKRRPRRDLLVHVPLRPPGYLNAARIAVGVTSSGDELIFQSPLPGSQVGGIDGRSIRQCAS